MARSYGPKTRTNEWLDDDPSPEGVARFLERAVADTAAGRGTWSGLWAAEGLAGAVGMTVLSDRAGIVTLDYLLAPAFRGRGLATRALAALVGHLFANTAVHRIEIQPDVANAASCAVAERLGFTREGVLRDRLLYADGRGDQAVYARLRSDGAPARRP